MTRRRWASLAWLVLAGAIINFIVAWAFLWWRFAPLDVSSPPDAQALWDRYAASDPRFGPAKVISDTQALGCRFMVLDASPIESMLPAPPRMMITRAGFPFHSFEAMHGWGPVRPAHSGGIRIPDNRGHLAYLSMLPLRPILIGCTLNTAFYGWLVWLAATMPRRISEMKRIVRGQATGLCPDCGYDMQGNPDSGCPECGWRRES